MSNISKQEPILQIENMQKTYMLGKRPVNALNNLTLTVNRGEFIAIMGPSGSGKTTLLNIIGCIDKPTSGKILLDGIDVGKTPENKLYKVRRDKMGFVFQSFNLMPYLNALENVELPLEGKIKGRAERKKRAKELLGLVGLSGRENHRPQRLSGGEQQRVAIARALANNPAIILADEPTGNLDSSNKLEIMKLLAKLNIQQGTTIIMVSHDTDAARHSERMVLLKDGNVIKEKQGLHVAKKAGKCPHCGGKININDDTCPSCKKLIFTSDDFYNT
jgi:putative ABC transport system ATP-binding protein